MTGYQQARICAWARKTITVFLLAGMPWATALADPPAVPDAMQEKINKAVDDGVHYLKSTAGPWGTWAVDKNHVIGYAAMPGLTLLECGVSPQSPSVQNAAKLVRMAAPRLDTTYEISLSILFLDKLGDVKDGPLIQKLAMRLIAGQTPTGGWTYRCPILSEADHKQLLTVLKKLDNPVLFNPVAAKTPSGGRSATGNNAIISVPPDFKDALAGTSQSATSQSKSEDVAAPASPFAPAGSRRWAWCIKMDDPRAIDSAGAGKQPRITIPARLRGLPVFYPPVALSEDPPNKNNDPIWGTSDNSNTQFAILALWAARRHQVPTTRTLNLIASRFYTSQNLDGSWGYHHHVGGDREPRVPMTCVGLLGLAVAHGLAHDMDAKVVQGKDTWIVNGLLALSKTIGVPAGRTENLPMANLYFMWSVERVGVLYNLPMIGAKDWYRWGAEILLANQKKNGNWEDGQYYGSQPTIDTCFALLFLKRVNLVGDLAKMLPFRPGELALDVANMIPKEAPPERFAAKVVPIKEVAAPIAPPPNIGDEDSKDRVTPARTKADTEPIEETSSRAWAWLLGMLVLVIGGSVGLALLARNSEEGERPNQKRRAKRNAAH